MSRKVHSVAALLVAAFLAVGLMAIGSVAPAAAQEKKPNILFIMGDDIGWMQVGLYHQGVGLGETPNIDRIGKEGASSRPTTPCRAAPRGETLFSLACIRCARG
jgi:hypothetical protein